MKEVSTSRKKPEVTQSPIQKYVDKIGQGLGLVSNAETTPPSSKSQKKKKNQRKDSETSSEEERWLDAIQSGKLDEVSGTIPKLITPIPDMIFTVLRISIYSGRRRIKKNKTKGSQINDC